MKTRKIFLRPVGGLCNRMRTLDSFFYICIEHKIDLVVLWTMDVTLNASFKALFDNIEFKDFDFSVIDVPEGFPEKSLIKIGKGKDSYAINLNENDNLIKNLIKSGLQKIGLTARQKQIIKELGHLPFNAVMRNEKLDEIYNSSAKPKANIRELDAAFVAKFQDILNDKLNTEEVLYINCCYRVTESNKRYEFFSARNLIITRVDDVLSEMEDSFIGLHIRKTDHKIAQAVSTDKKFKSIIDSELKANPKSKFFLSTDDPMTKQELVNTYGNKIVTAPVRSYDRGNQTAIFDAVVDLYCLSKAFKIYGSHQSSFSQTAADIAGKKEIIL